MRLSQTSKYFGILYSYAKILRKLRKSHTYLICFRRLNMYINDRTGCSTQLKIKEIFKYICCKNKCNSKNKWQKVFKLCAIRELRLKRFCYERINALPPHYWTKWTKWTTTKTKAKKMIYIQFVYWYQKSFKFVL